MLEDAPPVGWRRRAFRVNLRLITFAKQRLGSSILLDQATTGHIAELKRCDTLADRATIWHTMELRPCAIAVN